MSINLSAQVFADYCYGNFDLQEGASANYKFLPDYQSLPVCLIDCIYSLRASYNSVTKKIVKRYADEYMNGDISYKDDTISDLIEHINSCGGAKEFAEKILENNQELGGSAHIPKEEALLQLAEFLKILHIETIDDFKNFTSTDKSTKLLEIVIQGVKGIGEAGVNYLFMLTGDTSRCKFDVHIRQCIKNVKDTDVNISDIECQNLFRDTVAILKAEYPKCHMLTVAGLDGIIWKALQGKPQGKTINTINRVPD